MNLKGNKASENTNILLFIAPIAVLFLAFIGGGQLVGSLQLRNDQLIRQSANSEEMQKDFQNEEMEKDLVACTMDAKMCPDGSYVGRIGPDCRFKPCPEYNEVKLEEET